jgi:hypothetical protein
MTKTEVHISRHLYISKYENNWSASVMHLFLIVDNMLMSLIPALLGAVFFFVRKLNVFTHIYLNLAAYYLNVLKSGKWISRRSVNYDVKKVGTDKRMIPSYNNQIGHQIQQG